MHIAQTLFFGALLSIVVYFILSNIFKDTSLKTPGTLSELKESPAAPLHITNRLPETPDSFIEASANGDAALHAGVSIYNKDATGVFPQNHDLFEKPADFGSDVTNIKQFYSNNPEVFGKILGTAGVTNVADWEMKTKEMFQNAQAPSNEQIHAFNNEAGSHLAPIIF